MKLAARTRADSAAMGHFSISVTDESKVAADENSETTILTNLLLTSDLKGYVEQPNYYFNKINDTTTTNLDLVMLTHGYRRFEWKEILNGGQPPATYRSESGISIRGTAKNLLGKPLIHGTVSLISTMGGPVRSVETDEKGNFEFTGLDITDTAKFILQAVTGKGGKFTVIAYNKQQDEPGVIPQPLTAGDTNRRMTSYLQNHKEQWDQYAKYGLPSGRLLNEVKIKAIKRKDDDYRSSSLLGPGHADQVMRADEVGKFGGTLSTSLDGRLRGVMFGGPAGRRVAYLGIYESTRKVANPMLLVVDGVELPLGTSIDDVNPQSVETVEVLRFVGSAAIYGMDGGAGVIVITTKQGKGLEPKDIASKGILPIAVQGFYKARQFYAPKYEHPTDNLNRKDLRSTIYWQPELATDKEGNATIDFYNADGKGNYRVVVEGIDEKGNIGRQVFRYKVD